MSTTELARREQRAQRGIIQFAEELQAIRDGRLYPNAREHGAEGGTEAWKAYCRDRWSLSDSRIHSIIQAVPVLRRYENLPESRRFSMPSTVKASAVATLPEPVQDAILTDDPASVKEADVKTKAKVVRKEAKRIREQEGREPEDDELIAAANAVKPKPKKRKTKMKDSPFIKLASPALHFIEETADYAQTNVLTDTENDWGWAMVEKFRYHVDRLAERLYQPDHAKDLDEEFAAVLGGEES